MTEEQVKEENEFADRIARKIMGNVYPKFDAAGWRSGKGSSEGIRKVRDLGEGWNSS